MTKKKTTKSESTQLTELYAHIYADGFWVKEVALNMAAVGDLRDLHAIADSNHKTLLEVYDALGMGDMVSLAVPGTGTTRVEAVQKAWDAAREYRRNNGFPLTVVAREILGLPVVDPHPIGTFDDHAFDGPHVIGTFTDDTDSLLRRD